jgi:ribosomal 50S subunit-associated protein YjgA (DUF615 family)
VAAHFSSVQQETLFTSLRVRPSADPAAVDQREEMDQSEEVEQWEEQEHQQDTPAVASDAKHDVLSLEYLGDKIDQLDHMVGQCIEEVSKLVLMHDSDPDAPEVTTQGTSGGEVLPEALGEALEGMERRLSDQITRQIAALVPETPQVNVDGLGSAIEARLDHFETRLDDIATRSLPMPDTSDHRRRLAHIMTGINVIGRGQEALRHKFEAHSTALAEIAKTPPEHLDIAELTTQICTAIEETQSAAHPSAGNEQQADVAPQLMRQLQFAAAEMLADVARRSAQNEASAVVISEQGTGDANDIS